MTRRPSGSLVAWAQARTSCSDRAQRHPFVVQLVGDDLPALVLAAHEAGGRNADVLEERVVDVVITLQLHRHHAYAGGVHGNEEHGDPLVLGDVRIRAGGQPDVIGVGSQAGEHLGPVDDVLLAIAFGLRDQGSQIGARVGLRVADAEMDLPGQDLGEEELLLLLGSELHDGRADGVDGQHGHRSAAAHRLVKEDELLDGRATLPAPLLGPADAEPAVGPHLLDHLAYDGPDAAGQRQFPLDLRREQVLVIRPQLALQRLLLLGVADLHGVPPGAAS